MDPASLHIVDPMVLAVTAPMIKAIKVVNGSSTKKVFALGLVAPVIMLTLVPAIGAPQLLLLSTLADPTSEGWYE